MALVPERIIIVRHSERLDKVDRDWSRGAKRPHDSPITPAGEELARKLGCYLKSARLIDHREVVVLSSPMTRCVQTAHAIVAGLTSHVTPTESASVPVHVEDSLCEGAYWIAMDLARNRSLRGEHYPPIPVYHSPEHHKTNTSPLVASPRPLGLGPSPQFIKTSEGGLTEDPPVRLRCRLGAESLLQHKPFFGKTVICVGHGETCAEWARSICGVPTGECPSYTGFVELMAQPAEDNNKEAAVGRAAPSGGRSSISGQRVPRFGFLWMPQGEVFGTPHDPRAQQAPRNNSGSLHF